MPPKQRSKSQAQSLLLARETHLHGHSSALNKALESKDKILQQQLNQISVTAGQCPEDSDPSIPQLLAVSETKLQTQEEKTVLLQSALLTEKTQHAKLANELNAKNAQVIELSKKLETLSSQLQQLYQKL